MTDATETKPANPPRKSARERKAELRQTWRVWKPSDKPFLSDGRGGYIADDGSAKRAAHAAMLARRKARAQGTETVAP